MVGKARRFGSTGASHNSAMRNQDALYSLGRGNDAQVAGLQFGAQEGFTPIAQTGLQDTSKAFGTGQQFVGGIGFNRQLCELDEATGLLDITEEAVSGDGFDTPPGDCSMVVIGGDGLTSDLTTIEFPKFQGHRLCIFLNVLQTITVKHEATALVYAIKTPTNSDVVFTGASQAIQLVWSVVLGQWLLVTSGAGGGCPVICTENDLGTINGAVDLDWSIANFHRAVLDGDVTFNIINTPGDTLWQDICLEVQQDNVGGHKVDFIQGFANAFIPVVISGAGRYTSFQIYTYEEPGGVDIFQGFNKNGNNGPQVPGGGGLFQGFAGYIQTILSADQTTNIGINDHIEFDTIVDNDTLIVTGGVGQARGIFSGFRPGHTYECEVYISGQGSGNTLNWSAIWFDRVANGTIGTEAEQIAITGAVDRDSQFVGKAFFNSTSLGDSLEVRITNATALTSILNGSSSTEPTTFAIIKDCGVVESVINQPEPAPEDGELDIREMQYARVTTSTSAVRFDGRMSIFLNFQDVSFVGGTPMVRNMRMKGLMIEVTTKGAGIRFFNLVVDGADVGPVFEIPASTTGFIDYGAIDVLLPKDSLVGWKTSGGSSGDDWQMTQIVWFL